MIVTSWDGHLRVDRPEGGDTVTVTLLTVEPTTESRLRADLVAAFVTGDPVGPPTRLVVSVPDGRLPDDVATLVGARIRDAVTGLGGADAGVWLRLELTEVGDLAAAWAPYRARVLDPSPAAPERAAVGSWAQDLWTALGLPDWRAGATAAVPVFRGTPDDTPDDDPPAAQGQWLLPTDIADAAGCRRTMTWSVRVAPDGRARIELEVEIDPDGEAPAVELVAAPDEVGARWVPLLPDGTGLLRARVAVPDGDAGLRVRTRSAGGESQ